MKTIRILVSALTVAAGMTAQAQIIMKTNSADAMCALKSRLVMDNTRQVIRYGQNELGNGSDKMQIYQFSANDTYQLKDDIEELNIYDDMQLRKIEYTRDFNDTGWQLLYLPLKLNYEDWCNDFDVARLNEIHRIDSDGDGTMDEWGLEVVMIKEGCTEPHTPYVIRAHKTGRKTITSADATFFATMGLGDTLLSDGGFNFRIWGKYCRMYADPYEFSFVKNNLLQPENDGEWTPAMRWRMAVTKGNDQEKDINKIRIYEQSEGTGIESIAEEALGDGPAYDLSGRRVNRLTKGIYIKNGKKVVLK